MKPDQKTDQMYKIIKANNAELSQANEILAVRVRNVELQYKNIKYWNKLKNLRRWERFKSFFSIKRKPQQD